MGMFSTAREANNDALAARVFLAAPAWVNGAGLDLVDIGVGYGFDPAKGLGTSFGDLDVVWYGFDPAKGVGASFFDVEVGVWYGLNPAERLGASFLDVGI